MPSKWDQLRAGQAVEIEPGLSGRLNQEKKTLELSNGRILNVANNPNFFPGNEQQLAQSKQREYMEKGAKGPVGEFLHQYTSQGIPGGVGDIVSYITQSGEDYANRKAAEQQVSQRISKESPYISAAATGANIATDLALTRGMSGLKAAPLLTVGSAGSRLFTEPENVAGEALLSAGLGKAGDMSGNYLNRVAQRRAASRALPAEQEAVRSANMLGEQTVKEANALQQSEFNALKQNVKKANQKKLADYQQELISRKNRMIEAQNKRDAARFASSQEKKRLGEEYKLAKKQYDETLKNMPQLQMKAQEEFSNNVLKNAEGIEKAFPPNSKITSLEVDVPGFFDHTISKTGLAGSTEAAQAKRILTSLFNEEAITAKELASKYKAIEEAIQKSSPEVQSILSQFKTHLGEKIPLMVTDNLAFQRVIPSLKKQLEKDIQSVFTKIPSEKGVANSSMLTQRMKENLNQYFNELSPQGFIEKLKNGTLREELANRFLNPLDLADFKMPKGNPMQISKGESLNIGVPAAYKERYEQIKDLALGKIDNALARAEIKTIATDVDASRRLGAKVRKTYGTAEPVTPPPAPNPSSFMAGNNPAFDIAPVPTPPLPSRPSLIPEPTPPTPQSFIPQPEPNLAPAQGMAERMGDLLEKNPLGGKGLIDNPFTKLAGLKYLFGKAALPLEAGYLGMKGLTSPTAAGEAARMTFKQAGIQAIESWARKYPSYNNGILESPQDRRSLTKEIEDDFSIPLEQKAVLQSKVNRGKPLQEKL